MLLGPVAAAAGIPAAFSVAALVAAVGAGGTALLSLPALALQRPADRDRWRDAVAFRG